MGLWNYLSVRVKDSDTDFINASIFMEPNFDSPKRTDLDNRQVYFSAEKTYQLRWKDRGYYELGTSGDPNWQPSFGYWQFNKNEDSLIFNKGQFYETRYALTMANGFMNRRSNRYMSSNFPGSGTPLWSAGDTILYKEYFIKISN